MKFGFADVPMPSIRYRPNARVKMLRAEVMPNNVPEAKSYLLAEVVKMALPPEMTDGVRWLSRRLNRGELSGYRVGRTWRMTLEDVEGSIDQHRGRPLARDPKERRTDSVSGSTPTSRRQLKRGVDD